MMRARSPAAPYRRSCSRSVIDSSGARLRGGRNDRGRQDGSGGDGTYETQGDPLP